MYKVGDMVRVNQEIRDGFGRSLDSSGKIAIVLETCKLAYGSSYWVHFAHGNGYWIDEDDLTMLSPCGSI